MTKNTPSNDAFAALRKLFDWVERDGMTDVRRMADIVTHCLRGGGVVYACGNGGSASQAEHFAAELVGRFAKDRPSLPAHALTANSSVVTSVSNDFGFANVFARQIEGMGTEKDCLLALSTSGRSENVVNACRVASTRGMKVLTLTGQDGGPVAEAGDVALKVPDTNTPRIQELHLFVLHLICELVEGAVFSTEPAGSQQS